MGKYLVIGAVILLIILCFGGRSSGGGSSSNNNNGKGPFSKLDGLARNDKNYKSPWDK